MFTGFNKAASKVLHVNDDDDDEDDFDDVDESEIEQDVEEKAHAKVNQIPDS